MSIDPITITVKEAAAALGVDPTSVYPLLDAGKIDSRYFGRKRLVVVTSLREFAESLPTKAAS